MDVGSVMNTYSMMSLWNSVNPSSGVSSANVPLVSNLDSSVQEEYKEENYFGKGTNSELQDIYNQVEPSYSSSLSYDSSGNLSKPNNAALPSRGISTEYSNILPMIQNGESSSELANMNVFSQYNSIADGTYQNLFSKLYPSSQYKMYNYTDSLQNNKTNGTGKNLDFSV